MYQIDKCIGVELARGIQVKRLARGNTLQSPLRSQRRSAQMGMARRMSLNGRMLACVLMREPAK